MDLSDLPAEITLFTEPACSMVIFTAFQSFLIEVWVLRRTASCALPASLFIDPDYPDIDEGSPRWWKPSRRIFIVSFSPRSRSAL